MEINRVQTSIVRGKCVESSNVRTLITCGKCAGSRHEIMYASTHLQERAGERAWPRWRRSRRQTPGPTSRRQGRSLVRGDHREDGAECARWANRAEQSWFRVWRAWLARCPLRRRGLHPPVYVPKKKKNELEPTLRFVIQNSRALNTIFTQALLVLGL